MYAYLSFMYANFVTKINVYIELKLLKEDPQIKNAKVCL